MDLDTFSRQIDAMAGRLRGWARPGADGGVDPASAWEQVSSAIGETMEEMRVAAEELRRQEDELLEWRDAVEAERHRYRELFDFAPDPHLVTDGAGLILEANRAAVDLLGVPGPLLRGRPLANFLPIEDRSAFRRGMHRLLQAGRGDPCPARIRPRAGGEVVATIAAEAVRDRDGRPVGIRWTLREAAAPAPGPGAEAGDDGLRELLDAAGVIAWEVDAETGRVLRIGPGIEPILGYPIGRWAGEPGFWASIVHPDDRPLVEARRRPGFPEGRDRGQEYRLVAADGRIAWFRETLARVPEGPGRPAILRGILWEITRRKKVERQLYTDRHCLAERLSDLSYLYSLEGQLLQTLDLGEILEEALVAVASLLGAESGAIRLVHPGHGELEVVVSLGLSPEYLGRFGRVPLGVGPCGLAAERLGPVIIEEIEAEPAARPWLDAARIGGYRASFSLPLLARGEELIGAVALHFAEPHRPSPRQVQLAEQYIVRAADAVENASRHRRACESDRRKQDFLATLAHELRNPIAAIRDWAQLLGDGAGPGALADEAREVIVRQAGVMARLVDDLLDAARARRGEVLIRKEPVDLAALADRAAADLRPMIEARGQQLEVTLPDLPIRVDADPTRIGQVLANLLTNASKFTDPGGRIDLIASVDPADGRAVLRIRDTGIGLESDALAEVFEPFARAVPARDRDRGGLGIGLALVRSLVELHGGTVTADSPGPGRGSEFVVRLPIARPETASLDARGDAA